MNDNDNDNNDFLNNMFNNESFKKHLDNLNPEDFMDEDGNINYDKLRKESFKMFEEISGTNLDDLFNTTSLPNDKLFTPVSDNKVGLGFVQDLDTEEGRKMFDDLVKQHNLRKKSDIIEIEGEEHVHETWTNAEGTVDVKRVYKLNGSTASNILSSEEQIKLYEDKMNEAVIEERYEEAAKFRDSINSLKGA